MITLTAKINLLSGDNKALSFTSTNLSGNNLMLNNTDGSGNLSNIVGTKGVYDNPFLLGVSKLGDGSRFSKKYLTHKKMVVTLKEYSQASGYVLFCGAYPPADSSVGFAVTDVKTINVSTDDLYQYTTEEGTTKYLVDASYSGGAIRIGVGIKYNVDIYIKSGVKVEVSYAEVYPKSYFISDALSDENGNFPPDNGYIISIGDSSAKITSLTIAFDTANNRHPNSIIVDGIEYQDDDAIFTVMGLQEGGQGTHDIRISNWNTPNYPLVITGIYAEVSIDIDRRNLISMESSIFDRSDLKLPSFGIISNRGNIEFKDTDGEILDYAEQVLLQSGLSCEIRLNNTLKENASQIVAKMETDQWDYDNDGKVVSVSIKDDLEEWQEINVPEISYDPRSNEHKSFSYFYEYLWGITTKNGNYDMLSLDELDMATQEIIRNTYTKYPLLKSGSLWQQWTKFCQVLQLHIYKNSEGRIVCRYNGGN